MEDLKSLDFLESNTKKIARGTTTPDARTHTNHWQNFAEIKANACSTLCTQTNRDVKSEKYVTNMYSY